MLIMEMLAKVFFFVGQENLTNKTESGQLIDHKEFLCTWKKAVTMQTQYSFFYYWDRFYFFTTLVLQQITLVM